MLATTSRKSGFTALVATVVLAFGLTAGPASAQTTQNGLVNVAVVGNTVQVPIGVAANVCGIQAAVLAQGIVQGPVNCTAVADATATAPAPAAGGTTNQQGLVNLAIENNTIQVPVAVAANICGVQVAVLATAVAQGATTCNAEGNADANV